MSNGDNVTMPTSMRQIVRLLAICLSAIAVQAGAQSTEGRLTARPAARADSAILGERYITSSSGEGYSYVPSSYRPTVAAPVCVLLHGAGGNAQRFIRRFESVADSAGVILLAPQSHFPTWDLIYSGDYGYDVIQIDALLREMFRRYRIDERRLCVAGFSDGASYALSLGRANGDLFTHVIAFSPGFIATGVRAHGRPLVFMSHGTADNILPIERTGRRVLTALERDRYRVLFREFSGGHTVPADVAIEAFAWLQKP
jgi:phospholipase/carboxylesterase